MKARTVFAPATIANLAVGFDNLGVAIHGLGDTVTVRAIPEKEVRIRSISGAEFLAASEFADIPKDVKSNTATGGLLKLLIDVQPAFGFEVEIEKGIPLGSGLGGSAASAVGAVLAANDLLPSPLSKKELLRYTLEGEAIASAAKHADNVAPCLFGGLVLVGCETADVISLPFPESLCFVVVHPGFRLDTKKARSVLPSQVDLDACTLSAGRLARFVAGCFQEDLRQLAGQLTDDIIEPARGPLIPGFAEVKTAANAAGALACSISGAGPAVFALCDATKADAVRDRMVAAFQKYHGDNVRSWISGVNKQGAVVVK